MLLEEVVEVSVVEMSEDDVDVEGDGVVDGVDGGRDVVLLLTVNSIRFRLIQGTYSGFDDALAEMEVVGISDVILLELELELPAEFEAVEPVARICGLINY